MRHVCPVNIIISPFLDVAGAKSNPFCQAGRERVKSRVKVDTLPFDPKTRKNEGFKILNMGHNPYKGCGFPW